MTNPIKQYFLIILFSFSIIELLYNSLGFNNLKTLHHYDAERLKKFSLKRIN